MIWTYFITGLVVACWWRYVMWDIRRLAAGDSIREMRVESCERRFARLGSYGMIVFLWPLVILAWLISEFGGD